MAANSDFFGRRNAQAVLKHGVLTRYAHYFAGRAGKAAKGRVAFIDGYAGEGRYEDGSPGSPLLLASQANRAQMFGRDVKLAFVEEDDARREQLRTSLAANEVQPDKLLGGKFEDVADELLDRYQNHAVLLFVDPFGLGISHDTLKRVLRRSTASQPIDVLFHFSLSTVARMGRAGISDAPGAAKNAEQVERALGPIGWAADFEGADQSGQSTRAAIAVAERFGYAIGVATGKQCSSVPVRQRPDQLPKYLLMLFSSDKTAHWDFADVASKAYVDWLHHCDTADYESNIRRQESSGSMPLFEDPVPDRDQIETLLGREAATYLLHHLPELLERRGVVKPIDAIPGVYGEMLGRARSMHIRSALKQLHSAERVTDDGKGDFWLRDIRLTNRSNLSE